MKKEAKNIPSADTQQLKADIQELKSGIGNLADAYVKMSDAERQKINETVGPWVKMILKDRIGIPFPPEPKPPDPPKKPDPPDLWT